MQYEIEIYRNGITSAPGPEIFFLSDWEKQYKLYTYVFVIKGENFLMMADTGCGDIDVINEMLFKEFKGKITFDISRDETIEAIINKSKIEPEKVQFVFISHLHHDHSSNVDLFPNAKVILSRNGWLQYMNKNKPYYYNDILFPIKPIKYIASLPSDKIIFVDNFKEKEIIPGIKSFWVGGHTPCCLALQINTAKGKVVLSSDIAFLTRNIIENHPIGLFYNLWECYEGYKKIKENADIILTSHDPDILESTFPNGKIK